MAGVSGRFLGIIRNRRADREIGFSASTALGRNRTFDT